MFENASRYRLWRSGVPFGIGLALAGCAFAGCGPAPSAQTASIHVESPPPQPTATAEDDPTGDGAEDDASPGPRGASRGTDALTVRERNERTKAIYKRGVVAQEAGHCKEAIELFFEANRVVPGAMPKLRIAQCMESLGRPDEAIRYYEIFIAEAPDKGSYPDKVEEARRRVDALNQSKTTPKPAPAKP